MHTSGVENGILRHPGVHVTYKHQQKNFHRTHFSEIKAMIEIQDSLIFGDRKANSVSSDKLLPSDHKSLDWSGNVGSLLKPLIGEFAMSE